MGTWPGALQDVGSSFASCLASVQLATGQGKLWKLDVPSAEDGSRMAIGSVSFTSDLGFLIFSSNSWLGHAWVSISSGLWLGEPALVERLSESSLLCLIFPSLCLLATRKLAPLGGQRGPCQPSGEARSSGGMAPSRDIAFLPRVGLDPLCAAWRSARALPAAKRCTLTMPCAGGLAVAGGLSSGLPSTTKSSGFRRLPREAKAGEPQRNSGSSMASRQGDHVAWKAHVCSPCVPCTPAIWAQMVQDIFPNPKKFSGLQCALGIRNTNAACSYSGERLGNTARWKRATKNKWDKNFTDLASDALSTGNSRASSSSSSSSSGSKSKNFSSLGTCQGEVHQAGWKALKNDGSTGSTSEALSFSSTPLSHRLEPQMSISQPAWHQRSEN